MQEFPIKNNHTGLKVYINGITQADAIPKDKLEILVESIALQLEQHYKCQKKKK